MNLITVSKIIFPLCRLSLIQHSQFFMMFGKSSITSSAKFQFSAFFTSLDPNVCFWSRVNFICFFDLIWFSTKRARSYASFSCIMDHEYETNLPEVVEADIYRVKNNPMACVKNNPTIILVCQVEMSAVVMQKTCAQQMKNLHLHWIPRNNCLQSLLKSFSHN